MKINLIQQLKNKPGSVPSKLLSQGESPDDLLEKQVLEIENMEGLTKENYDPYVSPFGIQLDQKLQDTIATLEVESPDSDQDLIVIRCRHGLLKIGEQLNTEPIEPPKISFVEMVKKINDLIGTIYWASTDRILVTELRRWLINLQKKLKKTFQHELSYLIINDRTKFEIPWEILILEDDTDNYSGTSSYPTYLGASIVTVRWQDIIAPSILKKDNSLIDLEIEEKICCGNIVAYLDTKDFPSVKEEETIIKEFNSLIYEDIHNFLDYFKSVDLPVSLIFIASHGSFGDCFGDDVSKIAIGEKDIKKQISLPQLHRYRYNFVFLKNNPSIVFLNACHSGRLQRNNRSDIRPLTGLSTFFLEIGAKGVIGTLCKVDDKYAAMVSHNFFTEYKENPELSVATILRNLRLKAAEKFKSESNDENEHLFLATFMYIYYGNPMTKLELTKREDR